MDTHTLANILMDGPKREVSASIDVSTDDSNAHQRCISDCMLGVQWEGDGTVTFLFEGGYDNEDA